MAYYYNNEIYHHGVKGMKWGVRHERKKSPRKKSSEDESNSKKRKGLSDKQKRAIKIGASAAASGLLNYGGYGLHKSGKLNGKMFKGKEFLSGSLPDEIKHLSKSETKDQVLASVNPLRGTGKDKNNCVYCGIATQLRLINGLDVKAGSTGGQMQNMNGVVESVFKFKDETDRNKRIRDGSAIVFGRSRNDAERLLKKWYGDNASGVCQLPWKRTNNSEGHTFNWIIKNGVVEFLDGQNGYGDEQITKYWKIVDLKGPFQAARLDGLEVKNDEIKKIIYRD